MRLITASDLMSPDVLTVREDMTVTELAAFLVDNEITGAPVVDEEGRPVGVVSVVDVAAASSEEEETVPDRPGLDFFELGWDGELREEWVEGVEDLVGEEGEELTVGDIMTPTVYSVSEDATVSTIATLLLDHHLHRVLVTRGEQVVGIITTSDLLGLLVDEK